MKILVENFFCREFDLYVFCENLGQKGSGLTEIRLKQCKQASLFRANASRVYFGTRVYFGPRHVLTSFNIFCRTYRILLHGSRKITEARSVKFDPWQRGYDAKVLERP